MDSGDSPPFGAALKRHRLAAGLTHEALAERAGLSARAISDLERGVARAPCPTSLRLLADALGLAAEERTALAAAARPAAGAGTPAAPERRHNLPAPLTSFVGREPEMAAVHTLLSKHRLVTLTGPGGAGKTRLALQVAAELLPGYPDGVWLAELAALADPALVPQAAAAAVGVREEPGRPLASTLAEALKPKRLLLVLDNCEHLLEACARLTDALLRACPMLTIVATSREALGIAGEAPSRVPSLSLPDAAAPPGPETVEALARSEAVRLFTERAAVAQPGFAVTDANAPAVAALCRRLDGIPLALELAAARVRALPVEQLLGRLEDRFRLLTGGSRTAPERHQTLRATVDWSYDLLAAPEQTLFARLSVFAGGWTLEAAEAVGAGDGIATEDVLDLLTRLVDQSLVDVVAEAQPNGTARYRLLETLRQYAQGRGAQGRGAAAVRRRHVAWYLALAERAAPELLRAQQHVWLDRLEQEHDNLRAALRWALDQGDGVTGVRLGAGLWRFWATRGHAGEGRRWLAQALALPASPAALRAAGHPEAAFEARFGAGLLAYGQGDLAAARALVEQARAEADDPRGGALSDAQRDEMEAAVLTALGNIVAAEGDVATARARYEAALALRRRLGEPWALAVSLGDLGRLAARQGDDAAAGALLGEALACARQTGDRSVIAAGLARLGVLALRRGERRPARAQFEEALALARAVGDQGWIATDLLLLAALEHLDGDDATAGRRAREALRLAHHLRDARRAARALEWLAVVAGARSEWARAVCLAAAAARHTAREREPAGPAALPASLAPAPDDLEAGLAAARRALGQPAAAVAWARGRAMTPEEAVAEALGGDRGPAPPAAAAPIDAGRLGLTPREREVAALVARGLTNRQIAEALVISERTAMKHVEHILDKLEFSSRVQVGVWVAEQGRPPPGERGPPADPPG